MVTDVAFVARVSWANASAMAATCRREAGLFLCLLALEGQVLQRKRLQQAKQWYVVVGALLSLFSLCFFSLCALSSYTVYMHGCVFPSAAIVVLVQL